MAIHGQSHSGYLWIFLKLAGVHPIDLSKVQIIQSFGTWNPRKTPIPLVNHHSSY